MNALSIRHYGASHGSHSHDHFQILVGLHGTLELEVAGRGWRIDAGNGFVVPPGERHDFESREGSSCLVLDTGAAGWSRCPAQPRQTDVTLALARYLSVSLQAGQTQALQLAPALLLQAWGPAIGALWMQTNGFQSFYVLTQVLTVQLATLALIGINAHRIERDYLVLQEQLRSYAAAPPLCVCIHDDSNIFTRAGRRRNETTEGHPMSFETRAYRAGSAL